MKTQYWASLAVLVGTEAAKDDDMLYRTVCFQRRPVNFRELFLVATKIGVRHRRRDHEIGGFDTCERFGGDVWGSNVAYKSLSTERRQFFQLFLAARYHAHLLAFF